MAAREALGMTFVEIVTGDASPAVGSAGVVLPRDGRRPVPEAVRLARRAVRVDRVVPETSPLRRT